MSGPSDLKVNTGSAKSIRVSIPISDGRESSPLETVREDFQHSLASYRDSERAATVSPSENSFRKSGTGLASHTSEAYVESSRRSTALQKAVPFNSRVNLTAHSTHDVQRLLAARSIERAWMSYRDSQMFKLLKHSLCAAEASLSHEILRKICPREAELLRDKGLSVKVRFRFGGSEFPPMIYFKIFSDTTTAKVHYISGRHAIQPATQAAMDARDRMGSRKYFEIMLQDAAQRSHLKITDAVDVTTTKDYMRYLSNLDETPAHLGGKDNTWRKLLLDAVPRATMFYDVVDYVYSRALSDRLRLNLPLLLRQPSTEDVRARHAEIISTLSAVASAMPYVARNRSLTAVPQSGKAAMSAGDGSRRWKQRRAAQLRKMYGLGGPQVSEAETAETGIESVGDDGPEDDEADKLYQWSQELSLEDVERSFILGSPVSVLLR